MNRTTEKSQPPRLRTLIAYYGALQTIHLSVLGWAGIRLWQTGVIGFPAPPPEGGWAPQTVPFLLALAGADVLLIVLSLVFVYGYFRNRDWNKEVGLLALGGFHVSALVFGWGTIQAGAWSAHPGSYIAMLVLFIPVTVLLGSVLKEVFTRANTSIDN
jgi:hypothetical protein